MDLSFLFLLSLHSALLDCADNASVCLAFEFLRFSALSILFLAKSAPKRPSHFTAAAATQKYERLRESLHRAQTIFCSRYKIAPAVRVFRYYFLLAFVLIRLHTRNSGIFLA